MAKKPGLYANINKRKKQGISRSKKNSTISAKAYANMKAGFPKKKKKQLRDLFRWQLANTEVTGIAWPSAEDNPDRKGADVTAYIKIYS